MVARVSHRYCAMGGVWAERSTFSCAAVVMGSDLAGVVQHFNASYAFRSYAAQNGLNVIAAQEPLWADPDDCVAGETPLARHKTVPGRLDPNQREE